MTRLGPLTSQALGRSPHEPGVIMGEGEGDPRAPVQIYDERGRPVNPETKRVYRDVVRAHNEVMQVIGVAEPDTGAMDAQTEMRLKQQHEEELIGRRLVNLCRLSEVWTVGWGLLCLRERVLVYRPYGQLPFFQISRYEGVQRSLLDFFTCGLPAQVAADAVRYHSDREPNYFFRSAAGYVRLHIQFYTFLQQLGLVPARPWLPSVRFFIPFIGGSAIPAPPPIAELSVRSALQWLGVAGLNTLPLAAYTTRFVIFRFTSQVLWTKIFEMLPSPTMLEWRYLRSPPPPPPPQPGDNTNQSQPAADGQTSNDRDAAREEAARALDGAHTAQEHHHPGPVGTFRRQSTLSSRGDEYGSDEEEPELASATLISFDVEATDSTDSPPGVWSAELRPNIGDARGSNGQPDEPVYADNGLTRLPAVIAADVLSGLVSAILLAPVEAVSLRLAARLFRSRRGLPVYDIYPLNPLSCLSWDFAANYLSVSFLGFAVGAATWGMTLGLTKLYRGCNHEWSFFRVVREKLRRSRARRAGCGHCR